MVSELSFLSNRDNIFSFRSLLSFKTRITYRLVTLVHRTKWFNCFWIWCRRRRIRTRQRKITIYFGSSTCWCALIFTTMPDSHDPLLTLPLHRWHPLITPIPSIPAVFLAVFEVDTRGSLGATIEAGSGLLVSRETSGLLEGERGTTSLMRCRATTRLLTGPNLLLPYRLNIFKGIAYATRQQNFGFGISALRSCVARKLGRLWGWEEVSGGGSRVGLEVQREAWEGVSRAWPQWNHPCACNLLVTFSLFLHWERRLSVTHLLAIVTTSSCMCS